jgi:hypothetical protein
VPCNCRVTAIADGLAAEGGARSAARAAPGATTRSGRTCSGTAAAASRPQETSGDVDTAYQQAMRKWQVCRTFFCIRGSDMRPWHVPNDALLTSLGGLWQLLRLVA